MVKFALYLFAVTSISAQYSVDFITVNKRSIQEKEEKLKTVTTDKIASDNIVAIHGNFSGYKYNFGYNISITLNKRFNDIEHKEILFLGENCYLSIPIKKLDIVFGRYLFPDNKKLNSAWKDGMEGVGIQSRLNNNFHIYLYLVDFYRAYPLFEKNFFLDTNQNQIQKGERFRHGLTLVYQHNHLFSKIHFTYLNLGNWGKGTTDDLRSQPKGDSDFLYTTSYSLSNQNKYFTFGFQIQIVRGLDKTQSNSSRKDKSLPISGELLQFFFESHFRFFTTRLEVFLPDTDKRNQQGETLELGFIGTGSYPGKAFLLNQEINFYPSAWITPNGLQKVNSIQGGRVNSFWTNLFFSMRIWDVFFILEGDYILPRLTIGPSTGSISFERRDYEKTFLFEATASILYDRRYNDGFFIRCNFSKLYTSKTLLLDGTSIYLQGGVIF